MGETHTEYLVKGNFVSADYGDETGEFALSFETIEEAQETLVILSGWLSVNNRLIHQQLSQQYLGRDGFVVAVDCRIWCRLVTEMPVMKIPEAKYAH